jgi:hypothetical protein
LRFLHPGSRPRHSISSFATRTLYHCCISVLLHPHSCFSAAPSKLLHNTLAPLNSSNLLEIAAVASLVLSMYCILYTGSAPSFMHCFLNFLLQSLLRLGKDKIKIISLTELGPIAFRTKYTTITRSHARVASLNSNSSLFLTCYLLPCVFEG